MNSEWEWYENYLHAVRMNLLILGKDYDKSLELVNKNDTLGTYEQMKKSGYLFWSGNRIIVDSKEEII